MSGRGSIPATPVRDPRSPAPERPREPDRLPNQWAKSPSIRENLRALALLTAVTVPFYWRILSHQFSLLTSYEGANQAFAWLNFVARMLKQGTFPIWDSFSRSGFPFAGEMQTGAFYPFYLLFALVPFHHGILSPGFYHVFFVGTHILCAFFMVLLARELSLSFFAALIAGICFSLGGFVGRMSDWMHMLQSSIWLPLILLFLIRALRSAGLLAALAYASFSGLCLALSTLAGGLHLVILQALAAAGALVFYTVQLQPEPSLARKAHYLRAALLLAVFAAIGLAGGAIQLLPAAEYSHRALRWLGSEALPATEKIPYDSLSGGLVASSFVTWLVSYLPGGVGSAEYFNPYVGVFPLVLAVIGVWKQWTHVWVRYGAGLIAIAFLYALGAPSILHGLLYEAAPVLWLAREAPRVTYLIGFGLALLAGFGADAVFRAAPAFSWHRAVRVLGWMAVACAVVLGYYTLLGRSDFNPWTSFSILLMLLSYGLFRYLVAGHRGPWAKFLVIGLIVFDLYAFDWTSRNVRESQASHTDELERLLSCRGAAAFLRAQPGRLRVQVLAPMPPSLGDVFGIQTTGGAGVTALEDFGRLSLQPDLLNARYLMRPAAAAEPHPVYQDGAWKIYKNDNAYPRAWLVHDGSVVKNPEQLWKKIDDATVDFHKTALLAVPLDTRLEPPPAGAAEVADIREYAPTQIEVSVRAASRALLVLSEPFYPGWQVTVNGREAPVWKVDGGLRAIVVPAGDSAVTLKYRPASFRLGAALSAAAFLAAALLAFFAFRRPAGQDSGRFLV
ncbi:MAG: YfhO family protein [Acidobacteriia bacterium]|nr:YfhO family protein [Terriglobia bacterium]